MADPIPTAADLRAEVARRRVQIYRLAAHIGIHPGRLGMMLRETYPLSPAIAEAAMRALAEMDPSPTWSRRP